MTQRRRNYKKLIWWGVGVLVIVLIVVGVVMGVNSQNQKNEEGSKNETEKVEQKKEADEKTESEKRDEAVAKQQEVVQYEGEDPNTLEELTGVVTYTGVSGGVLVIRTSIDQYLTEGICSLTLARNGDIIYSDTTNIVGDVATATCQGFDVATAELGEGNLEIIINLNADNKSGVIRGEASI